MRQYLLGIFVGLFTLSAMAAATPTPDTTRPAYHSTSQTLENITPEAELKRLIEGNTRFMSGKVIQRNLLQQAKATSLKGQFPAAVILSCMDSRGPAELILDQGLGDIFSVRVAGNVVDNDQLGGMEFATKAVGTKLIVVMGHTRCGAVRGACQHVEMGHLTALLNKIQPAVQRVKEAGDNAINCNDDETVDKIAKQNVIDAMKQIKSNSPIIADLIKNKQVMIVGAMHNLRTGKVEFFDENNHTLDGQVTNSANQ